MGTQNSKESNYSGYYGFASKDAKKKSYEKYAQNLNNDESRKKERALKRYRSYGLKFARDEQVSKIDLEKYIDELVKIKDEKL
ncbi:hypothetical protein [Weissella viridescens]|uniref:hypothetical protein n=1 Tax=Weissella viridescens TaxID=1629 RepID=UPI003AF2E5A6